MSKHISSKFNNNNSDENELKITPKNKHVIIEIFVDKFLDNYFENYEKSN